MGPRKAAPAGRLPSLRPGAGTTPIQHTAEMRPAFASHAQSGTRYARRRETRRPARTRYARNRVAPRRGGLSVNAALPARRGPAPQPGFRYRTQAERKEPPHPHSTRHHPTRRSPLHTAGGLLPPLCRLRQCRRRRKTGRLCQRLCPPDRLRPLGTALYRRAPAPHPPVVEAHRTGRGPASCLPGWSRPGTPPSPAARPT